jgi:PilZ domain
MSDQQSADLAILVSNVLPSLPCEAVSPLPSDPARTDGVSVQRRDGDRFVVRWGDVAPDEGSDIELHITRAEAVYVISGRITGLAEGSARLVSVTELRRRRQRRGAPRAIVEDLIVISRDGDVDAELVDVSSTGVSFVLDRPLPVDERVRTLLNFHGTVVPAVAVVRQVKRISEGRYRTGCAFAEISDEHRYLLARFAAENPIERRGQTDAATLRGRLRSAQDSS